MRQSKLKERALQIAEVPSNYELKIEDYNDREATFCWAETQVDEGISITLTLEGNLVELDKEAVETSNGLTIEKKIEIASNYLQKHYDDAFDYLKIASTNHSIIYSQYAHNLPLDRYGCTIRVDDSGQVYYFNYLGYTKELPYLKEEQLLPPSQIVKTIQNMEGWSMRYESLNPQLVDVEEKRYAPIYMHDELMRKFNALNEEVIPVEVEEPAVYTDVNQLPPSEGAEKLTAEEIVGITPTMEVIRQVDMGEELGIVWREKDYQLIDDLSWNGFMHDRTAETAKVLIDKKTGRLNSFFWFKNRQGTLQLTKEDCQRNAQQFLSDHFAEYIPHLYLRALTDEETTTNRCHFMYDIHNSQGEVFATEMFVVVVNRQTGLIDQLIKPAIAVEQIKQWDDFEVIPLEQLERTIGKISAQLQWDMNYDTMKNDMTYALCDDETKRSIFGIDAQTGQLICYHT